MGDYKMKAKVSVVTDGGGNVVLHEVSGEPLLHYELGEGESAIQTSDKTKGKVTLADGTSYDLTPRIVVHANEHLDELVALHDEQYHLTNDAELTAEKAAQAGDDV